MANEYKLPVDLLGELNLEQRPLLLDSTPQFPWVMMLKLDTIPEICFHALPSCKTFSVPYRAALDMKCNSGGSNEFLIIDNLDEEYYYYEFDSVHQLKLGRRRCSTSDCKLVALPPVLNLPKLFDSPPKKYKRPAMAVPFARYLARHNDRIFTYEAGDGTKPKHVAVIDDTTGEIVSRIQCPVEHLDHCYLISTKDSLLMIVKKSASPQYDAPHDNCQFVVYQLEKYDKEPHWTLLSGIGNEMIFLDMYNGFSLAAGDHDRFKGNCIYFISHLKWNPKDPLAHYVLAGFDMAENRCFEVCSLGESSAYCTFLFWFIPTMC